MADIPGSPPVKRAKTTDALATNAVETVEKKKKSVKATTEKVVAKGKELVEKVEEAAASHGIAVEPIKAKAEKAVKAASDSLAAVDWKSHIDPIKDQAGKTAKSAAVVAKGKTGSAMQSLAKLISDTAGTVDAKLGPQYGDYARQAAESVAGAADKLDSADVDHLLAEAKDFVRKSPAVAIGAAAVVGFVLMRLAKGSDDQA